MMQGGCWLLSLLMQVSNPSLQFMLYETLLKKLKQKRALSKNANKGVTALEASIVSGCWSFGTSF